VLTAYIDESARHRNDADSCVYVLAAALVEDDQTEELVSVLESRPRSGAAKLHWKDQTAKQRTATTEALAAVPLAGLVAVHFYDYQPQNERARRLCFNRLLVALAHEYAAGAAVFESRGASRDKKDREVLTVLRKNGRVPRDLDVSWVRGGEQPLLWAADCVAGAVTWSFGTQDEGAYLDLYDDAVMLIEA
jgi:hypothetical protein